MTYKYISSTIDYTKLFLEPPDNDYKRLRIDRESMTYITTPHNACNIAWIIRSNLSKEIDMADITLFDGTSGVGGDTIVFGYIFGNVIGCEIDKKRFCMLKNNVDVYELQNVTLLNENCLNMIFDINFIDVVYLDPPWGGKSYKNENIMTLFIGDKSIESLINDLLNPRKTSSTLKLIALKLPKNYNIRNLYDETVRDGVSLLMYELDKMFIMIFKIDRSVYDR